MSVSMRIALRTLHGFAGTGSGTGILRRVPQRLGEHDAGIHRVTNLSRKHYLSAYVWAAFGRP